MIIILGFTAIITLLAVPVYYAAPGRFRAAILLGYSLLFYAWISVWHTVVLCGIIVMAHAAGLLIMRAVGISGKRWALWSAAGLLIALLVVLKLGIPGNGGPAMISPDTGTGGFGNLPGLALMLGLSFVVIRTMGYLIDVYRGTIRAESNIVHLALFVSFFPQLLAGPIERYERFRENIIAQRGFERERVYDGFALVLLGCS